MNRIGTPGLFAKQCEGKPLGFECSFLRSLSSYANDVKQVPTMTLQCSCCGIPIKQGFPMPDGRLLCSKSNSDDLCELIYRKVHPKKRKKRD